MHLKKHIQILIKDEVRNLNLTCYFYAADIQILYLAFSPTRNNWWLQKRSETKISVMLSWMKENDFYCDIYKTGLRDPPTQWNYLQSSLSHSQPVWIIMCSLLHGRHRVKTVNSKSYSECEKCFCAHFICCCFWEYVKKIFIITLL